MKTDVQTWPALLDERKRMLESRLMAAQSVPERICNASTSGTYSGNAGAYYRNDGHKGIPSRGVRC